MLAAGRLNRLQESLPGELGVAKKWVVKRRHDDAGDLARVTIEHRVEALEVVPAKGVHVRPILFDEPAGTGRTPGGNAVIGAFHHEDLFTPGMLTRDLDSPGGHVGAVLGEHRPVGEVDELDKLLRELDHHGSGMIEAVAVTTLAFGGLLDLRMPIAEHDWAVSAHEIDELVAVHVPVPAPLGPARVVRCPLGDRERRCHVTVDATRDHLAGAIEEAR